LYPILSSILPSSISSIFTNSTDSILSTPPQYTSHSISPISVPTPSPPLHFHTIQFAILPSGTSFHVQHFTNSISSTSPQYLIFHSSIYTFHISISPPTHLLHFTCTCTHLHAQLSMLLEALYPFFSTLGSPLDLNTSYLILPSTLLSLQYLNKLISCTLLQLHLLLLHSSSPPSKALPP